MSCFVTAASTGVLPSDGFNTVHYKKDPGPDVATEKIAPIKLLTDNCYCFNTVIGLSFSVPDSLSFANVYISIPSMSTLKHNNTVDGRTFKPLKASGHLLPPTGLGNINFLVAPENYLSEVKAFTQGIQKNIEENVLRPNLNKLANSIYNQETASENVKLIFGTVLGLLDDSFTSDNGSINILVSSIKEDPRYQAQGHYVESPELSSYYQAYIFLSRVAFGGSGFKESEYPYENIIFSANTLDEIKQILIENNDFHNIYDNIVCFYANIIGDADSSLLSDFIDKDETIDEALIAKDCQEKGIPKINKKTGPYATILSAPYTLHQKVISDYASSHTLGEDSIEKIYKEFGVEKIFLGDQGANQEALLPLLIKGDLGSKDTYYTSYLRALTSISREEDLSADTVNSIAATVTQLAEQTVISKMPNIVLRSARKASYKKLTFQKKDLPVLKSATKALKRFGFIIKSFDSDSAVKVQEKIDLWEKWSSQLEAGAGDLVVDIKKDSPGYEFVNPKRSPVALAPVSYIKKGRASDLEKGGVFCWATFPLKVNTLDGLTQRYNVFGELLIKGNKMISTKDFKKIVKSPAIKEWLLSKDREEILSFKYKDIDLMLKLPLFFHDVNSY